jgi:DNA-binding HxlR family transcriptional regulator
MVNEERSGCPIAGALDLLGDRWTLVVMRDLLTGKRLYTEFLDSPEGISTNILADRLRRLEEWRIVERTLYSERPRRYAYAVTRKGADLLPTLQAISRWGNRYLAESWTPPGYFMRGSPTQILKRLGSARDAS